MSGENWDSYSHQELYDRIHGRAGFFGNDGAGVSGASGAQAGWGELATLMASAKQRTEAVLTRQITQNSIDQVDVEPWESVITPIR